MKALFDNTTGVGGFSSGGEAPLGIAHWHEGSGVQVNAVVNYVHF